MGKKNWTRIDKRNAAILKAHGFDVSDDGETASVLAEMYVAVLQLDDGTLRLCIDTPSGHIRANVIDLHEERLGDDPTIPPLPLRDVH